MAAAGHLASSTVAGTTGSSVVPIAGSTAPITPVSGGQLAVTDPISSAGSAGSAGAAGSVAAADEDASTGTALDAGVVADSGATNPWTTLFPPPPDAGPIDAGTCENLACFDIFDCALYHAAQFGPCKFTKCDALICKP